MIPTKKRSGPYVWEYVRPGKKIRSHKMRGLANVPQSAMKLISNKLGGANVAKLFMTSPKHVRNVLKPNLKNHQLTAKLRNKIQYAREVTPDYIRIVRRLQQVNRTPNENYEMRGNTSTGWHVRRIKNMENLLGRLVLNGNGTYRNGQKRYDFNKKSRNLVAVPTNPRGVYVTIARGVSKRPNGTLYFNLRKRHDRQRR